MTNNSSCKNSNSKSKKLIKILLIIASILVILTLFVYFYYKSNIDVSDNHVDEYEYTLGSNVDLPKYKLKDICEFNKNINKDIVTVKLPKLLVYKDIIKIEDFAKEINDKYKVNINKIGFIGDELDNSKIIVNADITYKEIIEINTYINMVLRYEFIENQGIKIFYDSLSIGDNVPIWLYKNLIPYKSNEILYYIDLSNYKLFNEETFEISNIKDIKINKENITFNANYMNTITNFFDDNLGNLAPFINEIIEEIAPNVIDEIINGNPDLSISEFLESILNKK